MYTRIKIILALLLLSFNLSAKINLSFYQHNGKYYVDDFEKIFSQDEILKLDKIIRQFNDTVQMLIVTIPTFDNNSPLEWAREYHNKIGVGTKANDGILIVLSKNDRKIATSIGNGLGKSFTDGDALSMQNEYAIPEFKNGNYFNGLYNYTSKIINHISPGANEHKEYVKNNLDLQKSINGNQTWTIVKDTTVFLLLSIFIIYMIFAIKFLNKRRRKVITSLSDLKDKSLKNILNFKTEILDESYENRIYFTNKYSNIDIDNINSKFVIKWYHTYEKIKDQFDQFNSLVSEFTNADTDVRNFYKNNSHKWEVIKSHYREIDKYDFSNPVYINSDSNKDSYFTMFELYSKSIIKLKESYRSLETLYPNREKEVFYNLLSKYNHTEFDIYKKGLLDWTIDRKYKFELYEKIKTIPEYGFDFNVSNRDILPEFLHIYDSSKIKYNKVYNEALNIRDNILNTLDLNRIDPLVSHYDKLISNTYDIIDEAKTAITKSNELRRYANTYKEVIRNKYKNDPIWAKIPRHTELLNDINSEIEVCTNYINQFKYSSVSERLKNVTDIYNKYNQDYNNTVEQIRQAELKRKRELEEKMRLEAKRKKELEDLRDAAMTSSFGYRSGGSSGGDDGGTSFGGGSSSGGGAESSW